MRLVSVTRTGNEADVVEAFVRHHNEYFDIMVIIDDSSTDGTSGILEKLKTEGFPLIFFKAEAVNWDQEAFVTRLMHIAVHRHDAAWVFPLDIDEFLEVVGGRSGLTALLEMNSSEVRELRWSNFTWSAEVGDNREINPVVRLRKRCTPRADNSKVAVPSGLIRQDPKAYLTHGNHRVVINGVKPRVIYHPQIALCHFPIRSFEQILSKIVINYLRYQAIPDPDPRLGTQYLETFKMIGDKGNLVAELERQSLAYSLAPNFTVDGKVFERPLDYLGGPLIYTPSWGDAFRNVVQHAEHLAKQVSVLEARLRDLKQPHPADAPPVG